MNPVEAFAALPRPSSAGSYSVAQDGTQCRVGKTYEGFPAVLVSFANENGAKLPRRLTNFAYQPPAPVEIRRGAMVESARLAIVECCTHERRLAAYFFRIVTDVLVPEAKAGDEKRFELAIDTVITLFKALQRPATRTVQGLWAELATIAFSSNPSTALSSWHSSARALHDFANGAARLEVKSTTKGLREHTFLLDQLTQGSAGQVLIASMMLSESPVGCSVFELVNLIRPKLASAQARGRLETIVADCLGTSFEAVDEHLYDLEAARKSLLYYRAGDIPTCPQPPPEVKDVSFTADLSTTQPVPLADSRSISEQFRDLLPVD